MVPICKKNGEIKLCIDFRNLNRSSKKDNYLVPPIEQILQKVAKLEIFSLLDDFSSYNQVLFAPNDQLKTTFRTTWGTFKYRRMLFGLINPRATFQRAMDIAFRGLIHSSIFVYLDDVTIYSKRKQDHLSVLKQVFKRCRKFSISLNPKKSIFVVTEGKLLGFIVSKEGMIIDPERAEAISKVGLPNCHKEM